MSIANDAWIRRMALEHGMITPFQEGQVAKGKISYGVSSYGYDVRVGTHFKIFHNLNSTLVDPKNFDAKSFVDHDGDSVIIPPNSFVLAETVERFRIPREVLCVCLGKSTYARCFTGDTAVALVGEEARTLEQLADDWEHDRRHRGYAMTADGRVREADLVRPRWIAKDAVMEVVLDSEARILCTRDHVFLRRDGTTVEAHELRPNDALMPLYRRPRDGQEVVYQPGTGIFLPCAGGGVPGRERAAVLNHRVASVRDLPGERDVYCLTVPEAGNFALDAGVFVRNCGIIVNVTPLEPEWEGVITIEISNTTPLPAKIYANEGIAQILFLRAAADGVCETSYADRKGKYQNQGGLTLPKIAK